VFRQFVHHRYPEGLSRVRIAAALLFCLALVGCADDDSQAQIDSLRDALATVNAETTSLRASRRVLQTRLAATQIAARTAGNQIQALHTQLGQLAAREAALSHANAQGAQRLRSAEAAIAHFNGQLAAASRALAASEATNTTLSRQLAAVSGWLGQRDALGQSQNNTLKNLEGDVQRQAGSLATLDAQLARQKTSLHSATAEANQLRTSNAQLDTDLKALQERFKASAARSAQRVGDLQRQRGELFTQTSSAHRQALKLQASAQRLSENNEQLKARMESLRNELVSANDNALRYEVAKDYLVDKVQSQEKQVDALKGVVSEARSQHKATIATMIEQQRELEAAAKNSAEALRRALARNEALQAEGARMGAQLTQSQLDRAASEQRARGAKQAKDYLDGKLSATMEELKATRAEQRMALLKVEHALQLSLEESRILQQRDRELRKQLQLVRKTAGEKAGKLRAQLAASAQNMDGLKARIGMFESTLAHLRKQLQLVRKTAGAKADELRAQLAASAQSMDGLKVRIGMFESTLAHLRKRNTKQAAQTHALRDEFAAKISASQAQVKAAVEAKATACAAARKAHTTAVRDLKWRNESLRQRNGVLEDRVRVLEIAQSACKLHKTAL